MKLFRKDIAITIINSIAVILGIFIINALISRKLGLDSLADYLYIRRIISSLVGISIVGMNISIPYFTPLYGLKILQNKIILIFIIATLPVMLLLTILVFFNIIPGIDNIYYYVFPYYGIAINAQSITYAMYRGKIEMVSASIFHLFCMFIIPVLSFSIFNDLKSALFSVSTGIVVLTTIIWCLFIFIDKDKTVSKIIPVKEILKFGLVRLPGFIGQAILLTGIPILLSTELNSIDFAYFNASLSILRLILLITGPIGIILLPRVSKILDNKRINYLKDNTTYLIHAVLYFGIIMGLSLVIYGEKILVIWIGYNSNNYLRLIPYIFLVIPFYALVTALRGIIDGLSKKGYNSTINVFSALVMIIVFYSLRSKGLDICIVGIVSYITGYFIASFLSIIVCNKIIGIKFFEKEIYHILVISSLLTLFAHWLVKLISVNSVLEIINFAFCLAILIVTYIFLSKASWIINLKKLIYPKIGKDN